MPDLAPPPAVHAALAALLAADKRLALDPNAPPGRTVLTLSGRTDAGDAIAIGIEYDELNWVTVIEVPEDDSDISIADLITPEMLVTAGYQAQAAVKIARELGSTGSYRVVAGKNGVRYVILKGYADLRPTLRGTRYLARNTAIIGIGLGPIGQAHVHLRANAIGIIFLGVSEVEELLAGEQDVVEAVVDIGFGTANTIVSGFIGAIISGMLVTATAPAWVPIATTMAVGFGVGIVLNVVIAKGDLKEKSEELLRWGAEQGGPVEALADVNFAP